MANPHNELVLSFLAMKLSAKGVVALVLALPVSVVLVAFAWRLVVGWNVY
jgi:hypothetical protein